MSNQLAAFTEPIKKGLIRILLRIDEIECDIQNDAPDFVNPMEDTPILSIFPENDLSAITDVFLKKYPLKLNKRKSKQDIMVWEVESGGIWFDMEMDHVKDVWMSEFHFFAKSEKPRYLNYYIKNVIHNIEWLQPDVQTGEIKSLSNFRKKFVPPPISGKDVFSGSEVIRCTDMLSRAIKKIDLRTKEAWVKFNTDNGRLESLITGMAAPLGYKIVSLKKEVIAEERKKGNSVSHSISLK